MKIYIIGASGSGKTYLADKLARSYGVSSYSLDDLLWDNSRGTYNVKRSVPERDAMLEEILHNDDWIIEGVQYSWCHKCFETADTIYFLDVPKLICRFRILRRFIGRKIYKNSRHNETLRSVIDLLKWTKKFYNVNLVAIKEKLGNYQDKVVILKSKKDVNAILTR